MRKMMNSHNMPYTENDVTLGLWQKKTNPKAVQSITQTLINTTGIMNNILSTCQLRVWIKWKMEKRAMDSTKNTLFNASVREYRGGWSVRWNEIALVHFEVYTNFGWIEVFVQFKVEYNCASWILTVDSKYIWITHALRVPHSLK